MKVGFIENFIACITKKYFKLSGRASRQEYWKFIAIMFLSSILIAILKTIFRYSSLSTLIMVIANIWSIFLIIPHWTVAVRRLHDTNKSGWMLLLPFTIGIIVFVIVNLINSLMPIAMIIFALIPIYLFYLFVKKGDVGPNKYGEDPYMPLDDETVFEEKKLIIEEDIAEEEEK